MHGYSKARQFASDLAAGAGIGAAAAWALATLFQVPIVVAYCAAGVVFLRVFCSLRQQHSGPGFALASFQPAALEFEADSADLDGGLLELGPVAASIASGPAPEPRAASLPTVKQMQESIQRRLRAQDEGGGRDDVPHDEEHGGRADAADELRAALRNLRRAIG